MTHFIPLYRFLGSHLSWSMPRLKFLSLFLVALIRCRTVNWVELSNGFNPHAESRSSYRRIQRFFANFDFEALSMACLLFSMIADPGGTYTVVIDRTTWLFGQTPLNLLCLGIVYHGVTIPLFTDALDKKGNSNTKERKKLFQRLVDFIGVDGIEAFVADREFIGIKWFEYLVDTGIPFVIRIRKNHSVQTKRGHLPVSHIRVGESMVYPHPINVMGQTVWLVAYRLPDQYVILATNMPPEKALMTYKKRWSIETLFGNLKSRGFNLEQTHVTDPKRLEKMVSILAIAVVWALKVGEWKQKRKPIKIKKHGRAEISLFRYGLDELQAIIAQIHLKTTEFKRVIGLLTCT